MSAAGDPGAEATPRPVRAHADRGDAAAEIRCRQCGRVFDLPEYHGVVSLVCPACRWREVVPARRHIPRELTHDAGAAFEAHGHRQELAAGTVDRLRQLSPKAFEQSCAGLFERWGHVVTPADPNRTSAHELELHDGALVAYVTCRREPGPAEATREAIENLVGVMRHDGVTRGVFVTAGDFPESCRAAADAAGIEVLDREELCRRLEGEETTERRSDETTEGGERMSE